MQRLLFAPVLALWLVLPVAAFAQPGPGPGGMAPPSPEMRAKIDALNAQAKTAGYAALTPDHRARVQAILARVTAGSLPPRDAIAQIDALVSPDEAKAVLAVAASTRTQMRAAFGDAPPGPPAGGAAGGPPGPPDGGPPPPPPPDGAGGPPGAPGPPHGGWHRAPTAGGFLLRVSITPEQMRALRDANRPPAP